MLKSSVIIGVIIATLLTSGISAAAPVMAGDRNCDVDISHPYCTGEEGAQGMIFCDLGGVGRGEDCYDRDFSRIDCDEHPQHSRCTGYQGREGLIFCDIQFQDVGSKSNCYDRNDNPEYCDNYAIDESDRWYKVEFCQSICDNCQEVIGRGELCSN